MTRREASVLIPVFTSPGRGRCLVLVRRTHHGVHGGQLAFPGGKRDSEDDSALATALREVHEEIGLPPDAVDVIAELPPIDTRTTGFRITPFLGRITPPRRWLPDPDEVAEVLEVRIADLARPDAQREEVMDFPTWPEPKSTPYYRIGEHRLWGVTYRILHPLLPRLAGGEWDF